MPYGEILNRAARIVVRHRYLWLLGFFGGGEASAGSFFPGFPAGPGGSSFQPTSPGPSDFQDFQNSIQSWLTDHLALIIFVISVVLLVGVILFLISVVASGAIVRAGAELDSGRVYRLREAWSAGVQLFWPVLGLKLLAFLVYLLPLAIGGVIVALIIVSTQGTPGFLLGIFLALLPLFFLYLLYALAAQVVMILALRAVVLDGKGVLPGIVSAVALLRRRLGRVVLTWLIMLGIGLAIGFGLIVGLLFLLIPLGLLVLIGWIAARELGLIFTGALAILLGTVGVVILAGAASAYSSTVWTLAYRRFDTEAATAPPQPLPA